MVFQQNVGHIHLNALIGLASAVEHSLGEIVEGSNSSAHEKISRHVSIERTVLQGQLRLLKLLGIYTI